MFSVIYVLKAEVAPHVGAWIEILRQRNWERDYFVAPHVGAWIEMY